MAAPSRTPETLLTSTPGLTFEEGISNYMKAFTIPGFMMLKRAIPTLSMSLTSPRTDLQSLPKIRQFCRMAGEKLVYAVLGPVTEELPESNYLSETFGSHHRAIVPLAWTIGSSSLPDQNTHFLLIKGSEESVNHFHPLMIGVSRNALVIPDTMRSFFNRAGLVAGPSVLIESVDIDIYVGDETFIASLLYDPTFSVPTRVGSLFYFIFPWVKAAFEKRYIIKFDHQLVTPPKTLLSLVSTSAGENQSAMTIALFVLHGLGPSYSQMKKLAEQLHHRAAAMCASRSITPPTVACFNNLLSQLSWEPVKETFEIDYMLSQVLCLNKNIEFDQQVHWDQLCPTQELIQKFSMDEIHSGLLEQARMVYQFRHTTSSSIALSFIEDAKSYLYNIAPIWSTEIDRLVNVAPTIQESIYAGVSPILEEGLRIAQFPRIVYFGLLVFKDSLATEAEKVEFQNYQLSSIKNHISVQGDIHIIHQMAKLVPKASVRTTAGVIKSIAYEQAEALMATQSREFTSEVLEVLRSLPDPGPWAMNKFNAEIHEFMATVRAKVSTVLLQQREQKASLLSSWREESTSKEEWNQRNAMVRTLLEQHDKIHDSSIGLEAMIPLGRTKRQTETAQEYLKVVTENLQKFTAAFDAIINPQP